VVEETLKNQLEEKECLESEIISLKREAKKKEETLTSHIKERYEDLNKIEEKFSQQERSLEEEIISLKT
jgi:hypothetical protein